MDTLQLNANGMPLSQIPLSVLPWHEAVAMVYKGKATVLKEYDHWRVRSQLLDMKVPSIIMMTKQVAWDKKLKYSANNVFIRDDYTCQLRITGKCQDMHGKWKAEFLTIDHVLPRSHKGGTNWLNVCTACKDCNSKKGNDPTILPKIMPYQPSYYQILKKRKTLPIYIRDEEWRYYIDWPEHLINVQAQPGENG